MNGTRTHGACRADGTSVAQCIDAGSMAVSERYDIEVASSSTGMSGSDGRNMIVAIGIDRYQHWPRLTNAVRDATGASGLFQQLGFAEVTEPLLDDRATGKAIQSLVTDDLMTLGPDDSLVLFFAGHGSTREYQIGGKVVKAGYLIPVDALVSPDKVSTWVDLEGWLRAVSLLPAKHILVVLDACHSGIALDPIIKWRDVGSRQDVPLSTLNKRRSRRIITSALDDQVALDSGPVYGHSLFTGCLIEGLTNGIGRDNSRVVTGSELALYVQRRVQTYPNSRQTPDFGTFAFDDRGEMAIPLAIARAIERPEEFATSDFRPWLDLMDLDDKPDLSEAESRPGNAASGIDVEAQHQPFAAAERTPASAPSFNEPAPPLDAESRSDDAETGVESDDADADGAEPGSAELAQRQTSALSTTEIVTPSPAQSPVPLMEIAGPTAPASHAWRVFVGSMAAILAVALIVYLVYGRETSLADSPIQVRLTASNPLDASSVDATPAVAVGTAPDAKSGLAEPSSGDCPSAMVLVPAGTFRMGSPNGVGAAEEHPQHEVKLSAYCIDRTEVTVKAYSACVAANGCSAALRTVGTGEYFAKLNRFCNGDDRPDHPINCVDWEQANEFCTWARKRLPTEAEWEYAARGNDDRIYPWGNEAPNAKRLNACGTECVAIATRILGQDPVKMYDGSDGWETTAPVGSFPDGASPFGVLDMAGNVWEWTADCHGLYLAAHVRSPTGATCSFYEFRGGGWRSYDAGNVRTAIRFREYVGERAVDIGFRCVRSADHPASPPPRRTAAQITGQTLN